MIRLHANDEAPASIEGVRVRLIGRFTSVSRRETANAVRRRGGVIDDAEPQWVIVGEEASGPESQDARVAAAEAGAECLGESELWRRLGVVDDSIGVRRLYSPAMLSELVGAPVAAIRRWTRRGLLRPVCRVNRLAYFDFEESRAARLLTDLYRQSGSLSRVDREVDRLSSVYPRLERPLVELPLVAVDGGLMVRDDRHLAEVGGQRQLAFDPDEAADAGGAGEPCVLSIPEWGGDTPRSLRERAWDASEAGRYEEAIEAWRLAMLESPPEADDHFTLAEWLYRGGHPAAARERYYAALELDHEHLEARVSLGCVLSDLGEAELALASLRGAIDQHEEFADAHFHLARLLARLEDAEAAEPHWRRFLEIAPESPWADEAREALGRGRTPK